MADDESPAAEPLASVPVETRTASERLCPPAQATVFLRLALAIEFLTAWIAALTAWSTLGGQYHIDMMGWHLKVLLPLAWAFACVRATMAALDAEKAWNARTWRWLAACGVLAAGMGLLAWYTHMQEPPEEGDEETGFTATLVFDPHGPAAG